MENIKKGDEIVIMRTRIGNYHTFRVLPVQKVTKVFIFADDRKFSKETGQEINDGSGNRRIMSKEVAAKLAKDLKKSFKYK